jgi:hypothetical protein
MRTYHHYGATLITTPIDRLWRDMRAMLSAPHSIVQDLDPADGVLAAHHSSTLQLANQWGDTTVLEEASGRSEAARTLTYRSTERAPDLAEYIATCTLQPVMDKPGKTFIEWTRAYRPSAQADPGQLRAFVAHLIEQDQAIAARCAVADSGAEVLFIDYTLGDAAEDRGRNGDANGCPSHRTSTVSISESRLSAESTRRRRTQ